MGTVLTDLANYPDRIRESRERLAGLEAQVHAERLTRNELLAEAVDEAGMTQGHVAKLAGISHPQLVRILARLSEGDDD